MDGMFYLEAWQAILATLMICLTIAGGIWAVCRQMIVQKERLAHLDEDSDEKFGEVKESIKAVDGKVSSMARDLNQLIGSVNALKDKD